MVRRKRAVFPRRKLTRLALLLAVTAALWWQGGLPALRRSFLESPAGGVDSGRERVSVPAAAVRVIDGDTFELGGRRIRVLGIDTPELGQLGTDGEDLGQRAAEEARRLVAAADSVEYLPYRNDTYGRLLAHVFLDGELYAEKIVAAGLAWESVTHYGDNGFPELAARIEQAARRAGKPAFQPPWSWRREHHRGRAATGAVSPGPAASGNAAAAPAAP